MNIPRGAGKVPTKATNVRPGRFVEGLGRRSKAPTPVRHDKDHPAHVHRPPVLVDLRQVKMIRAGLLKRDDEGKWYEVPNITPKQMADALNAPSPPEPPRMSIVVPPS